MNLMSFNGKKPYIGDRVYIDPMARIFGDVKIGDDSLVLFGAILRGDSDKVVIGKRVAILENVVIEAPHKSPVEIGDESIISHGAIVHGAKIGRRCLIGIGAIILNNSIIESETIVAAGTVVPPNKKFGPRKLVMGVPAREIRDVTDNDLSLLFRELDEVISKKEKYIALLGKFKR